MKNYRQGEVLILGMSNYYAGQQRELPSNVIIEGEITGHKHEVEQGKLYEANGEIVLVAQAGCVIKHPEHKPIKVPKGFYKIKIQREYAETGNKKVKD